MLGSGSAVAIALLLASTAQPESNPWSDLLKQMEQLMPPKAWAVLFVGFIVLAFLLTIGDQLSGIFSWLGVPSPLQRSQPSTDQLERTRKQLLKIVKKEVDRRLATSLHNLVKLDLYMEDQQQRVGNPKFELVPEDSEASFQAVNRVLHPKGDKPPLDLKLTQKIIEVFEREDIQGKLLILGDPGSGKTTELLQLAQDLMIRAEEDDQHPVPVILELSSWDGESIDKWLAKQLNKLYSLSEATTQQWLTCNQILLLLDGLDELGLTKQRQCIEQINQFLETTRTSELVVCCRREEYEAGQIELDRLNGAVYLEALKEDQIHQYFKELNRLSLWENVKGNSALLELAQKPLFLFMLVVAYQGNPIRNEQELFGAYIEKQLHEPGNQGTYKSGQEPSQKQTRHYLVWLAKQLENVHETEFLIEGLQPAWLSVKKQRNLYAWCISLSLGLSSGLSIGLSWGLSIGSSVGFIFGIIGLIFGLVFGSELESIQPKEKLQWSFRKGLGGVVHDGMAVVVIGGFLGAIFAEANLRSYDLSAPDDGLFVGGFLAGMIISGLLVGLVTGMITVPVKEKKVPNQAIRKGTQNVLIAGLFFGLLGGLIGELVGSLLRTELPIGLLGVLIGIQLGVIPSGSVAVIRHFILRIFLTQNGNTPWNYARFLDHAVKHRFIQRIGVRYRFVHDLLRKHFAAMPLE